MLRRVLFLTNILLGLRDIYMFSSRTPGGIYMFSSKAPVHLFVGWIRETESGSPPETKDIAWGLIKQTKGRLYLLGLA